MDPINNPITNLFDFAFDNNASNDNAFGDNGQDIRIIADQHLFDNGSDLFGTEPSHLAGQTVAVPHSNTRIDLSTHVAPRGFNDPQVPHQDFFKNNLELFADDNLDAGFLDFGPVDQPISQFMVEQFGENFGLSVESAQPIRPLMPNVMIEPETMLNQAQPSPQIMLATFEEQQQWQAFKSQQTQLYQPQPHTSQFQQTETSHQWANVGEVPGLALQSTFESPTDKLFQDFPDPEAPTNPQQTAEPSQQDLLSDEQIHLLQNTEPRAYVQPSVKLSPTNAAFSHGAPNAEFSPRSRSTRGRRSLSSRTSTPDQTPQVELAGLSFASLEDAEAAMPSRYIENAWKAPSDDPTIPITQQKRAKYVLDMFESFQDCSECKDNKNGNSYIKRWLGGPGSYYNLLAMEKVCWHMLDIAERLHNAGPESTNMYCEEALKKLTASQNMTFQQRIYHVCAILKYSKFACDQLMKGEGLETLVGAPKLKMSGATTMQVQNQKRQKWIVHGRTEDPHHSMPGRNEVNYQDEHGEVQLPQRKTKTKQKTKRPAPVKPRTKQKIRPANTSRDEYDDDEEAAHRRQSDPHISHIGYRSDIEMGDEPQQIIAAVLQIPTSTPQPTSKPQRNRRESRGTVSVSTSAPVASPVAAPASPESAPALFFPSSTASTPSSTSLKTKQPKHAASPEIRIPRAEVDAGRARFRKTSVDKQKGEKMRKKRETLLAAYRAAAKASAISAETKATARVTGLAPSISTMTKKAPAKKESAKEGAATTTTTTTTTTGTKIKTNSGTCKRPIDLTETDSEDEQPSSKAKRQHTAKEWFVEWMIRNDGSNEDDVRETGYASESGRLSDAENSDSDEGTDAHAWTDKKPVTNVNDDEEQVDDADDDEEVGEHQDGAEEDSSEQSDDSQSEQTPEEESEEESEESEHSGEDTSEESEDDASENSGDSDSETSSPSPSPIGKGKIEKATKKGDKIDEVHPLVKTSRFATKAEREAAKRKQQQTPTPEPSRPEVNTPPAKPLKRKSYSSDSEIVRFFEGSSSKRIKRNDGSSRKSTVPAPAKQTSAPKAKESGPLHDGNCKFIRRIRKATPPPEPSTESESELESEIEEIEPKSESEPKKSGPLRDAKGKFIRKRK